MNTNPNPSLGNEFKTLLEKIEIDINNLENKLYNLNENLKSLNFYRKNAAAECLVELLPNLKMLTIKKLQNELNEFEVPLKSSYLFWKKVDPSMSIDNLRIKLGAYIDNLSKDKVPKIWKEKVHIIDNEIIGKQDLIKEYEESHTEAKLRKNALEDLMKKDLSKIRPEVYERIKIAVTKLSEQNTARKYKKVDLNKKQNIFPSDNTIYNTYDGNSILAAWLFYEILVPDSFLSEQLSYYNTTENVFIDNNVSEIEQANTGEFFRNDNLNDVNTHYELGAVNFS